MPRINFFRVIFSHQRLPSAPISTSTSTTSIIGSRSLFIPGHDQLQLPLHPQLLHHHSPVTTPHKEECHLSMEPIAERMPNSPLTRTATLFCTWERRKPQYDQHTLEGHLPDTEILVNKNSTKISKRDMAMSAGCPVSLVFICI